MPVIRRKICMYWGNHSTGQNNLNRKQSCTLKQFRISASTALPILISGWLCVDDKRRKNGKINNKKMFTFWVEVWSELIQFHFFEVFFHCKQIQSHIYLTDAWTIRLLVKRYAYTFWVKRFCNFFNHTTRALLSFIVY